MADEKQTDTDWVREQRVEQERRQWLFGRLRAIGGWLVGALTAIWAGFDALAKFIEWVKK